MRLARPEQQWYLRHVAGSIFAFIAVYLAAIAAAYGVLRLFTAFVMSYLRWKWPTPRLRQDLLLRQAKAYPFWGDNTDEQRLERIRQSGAVASISALSFPAVFFNQALSQWLAGTGLFGPGPGDHTVSMKFRLLAVGLSVPMLFFGAIVVARARLAKEALREGTAAPASPEAVFWPAKSGR